MDPWDDVYRLIPFNLDRDTGCGAPARAPYYNRVSFGRYLYAVLLPGCCANSQIPSPPRVSLMDTLPTDVFILMAYLIMFGLIVFVAFILVFLWRCLDYAFDISGRWNRFAGYMQGWL